MRISDWSSDVCSSDLHGGDIGQHAGLVAHDQADIEAPDMIGHRRCLQRMQFPRRHAEGRCMAPGGDRKSVVLGTSVSARVDLGSRLYFQTKNNTSPIDVLCKTV